MLGFPTPAVVQACEPRFAVLVRPAFLTGMPSSGRKAVSGPEHRLEPVDVRRPAFRADGSIDQVKAGGRRVVLAVVVEVFDKLVSGLAIALTASMSDGLVPDSPAALIHGQLAHLERVGDRDGVKQPHVKHGLIRARQIEGGPADLVPPRLASGLEPLGRAFAAATGDHVEQLAGGHVDDRGGPVLGRGKGRGARTAFRPTPTLSPVRSGSGRQPTALP